MITVYIKKRSKKAVEKEKRRIITRRKKGQKKQDKVWDKKRKVKNKNSIHKATKHERNRKRDAERKEERQLMRDYNDRR